MTTIRIIAESKLNSVKEMISKALNDGKISDSEFKFILNELQMYNELKDKTHSNQSGIDETERIKLIQEGKTQALSVLKKIQHT